MESRASNGNGEVVVEIRFNYAGADVRGTIVIDNAAGRALRKKRVAVLVAHVLDCAGGFRSGDRVCVSFRGRDGGQYAVAMGIVCCDEAVLLERKARPADATRNAVEGDGSDVVIREQDLELLWPSASGVD